MNSRRGFFRKLGAFAATLALAPQLAFKAQLPLPNSSSPSIYYGIGNPDVLEKCCAFYINQNNGELFVLTDDRWIAVPDSKY